MYRLVGIGADCAIPETCLQAVKRYPRFLNTSLVDNFCAWEAKGKGGQVEKLCMEALLKGEQAALEQNSEGAECATNEDCPSGVCDQGVCLSVYPYGKFSEDTLAGQKAANVFRAKAGLTAIPESGEIDATTCAAWADVCATSYASFLESDPLAMPPHFVVDRHTGNAVPCFASGCSEEAPSSRAALGIGIGALGIVGALIYYRSRSAR